MRTNMTRLTLSSTLLLGLLTAGCDPMSHETYKGEVLASIRGLAAEKQPGVQPPPAEVVLLWAQGASENFNMVAERVPVTGKFPTEFRMDLYQPPPAQAGFGAAGARMNVGIIVAFKQGVVKTGDRLFPEGVSPIEIRDAMLGFAEELVLHIDKDVPADHPISIMTGGINKKGFHLVHTVPTPLAERQRRQVGCLQIFAGSAEECELDPDDDRDVALVPGGFEGHRVRLEVGSGPFGGP